MGDLNADPLVVQVAPRGMRPRDTFFPLECLLYDLVWPAGTLDSGTADSVTATTLTDAAKNWAVNVFRGKWVKCVATGQIRDIGSNLASALTLFLGQQWSQDSLDSLEAGGAYEIGPTGPVEALQLVGSPFRMRNPVTGQFELVPTTIGYLVPGAEDTGDPLEEQDYDCFFDATHHLIVTYAHKAKMITKLRVVQSGVDRNGAPYAFDSSFLRRVAHNGLGSALGGGAFIREFVNGLNGALHAFSNPTHGGSEMRPLRDYDGTPESLTPLVRLVPSPPIPGGDVAIGGPPGVAKFRSSVIPLEFDADARNGLMTVFKGATPQQVGVFTRQKQIEAFDPHIVALSRYLQLRTQWNYDPAPYDSSRYGALGNGEFHFNIGALEVLDEHWDKGYWLNPVTGVFTELDATLISTGIGDGWDAAIDGAQHRPYQGGPLPAVPGPTPFPGGYGAAVLRKTTGPNAGLCIAVACKLRSIYAPLPRLTNPSSISIELSRNAPTPWTGDEPEDEPRFVSFTFNSLSYVEPQRGFTGFQHLLFIGPFSEVAPTFLEAFQAGLLDAPPDLRTIPPVALVGTELANFRHVDGEPITVTVTMHGGVLATPVPEPEPEPDPTDLRNILLKSLRVSPDVKSYEVNGRRVERRSLSEILDAIDRIDRVTLRPTGVERTVFEPGDD